MRLRRRRFETDDITCREAVRLMSRYLEHQLGRDDRVRLEAHLTECDHCTDHFEHMRTTIAVTGELREEDLDPLAREDVMDLYRRWRSDTHRRWSPEP